MKKLSAILALSAACLGVSVSLPAAEVLQVDRAAKAYDAAAQPVVATV